MKKCIAFALALMLVLPLCGCHGAVTRSEFSVPTQFDTSREYEITFWAKNDTNNEQVAVYKKAVEDFEALYPNITVKIKWYTDYGRMYQDVITNIATDTAPNVCISYPDHIATYLTNENCVVPLDSLMNDRRYGLGGSELRFDGVTLNEIDPAFLSEGVLNGKQYALPFMRSSEVCYVNKTYVEALGYELPEVLTWDFVWEVSEAAMAKNEDGSFALNGQKTLIPFIYKSTDNMMIQMLRQLDAGYSTAAGHVEIFNDETEKILRTVAQHAQSGAFSTFKISSYPANFLNAGQCIFAVDSTAGATWMGSDAPNVDIAEEKLVEFETAVMAIPQADADDIQMISQGPSVCVFNKEDAQEVLASWLFAQFLLTDEVQLGYAKTEGYVPVTSKAQQSEAYQSYLSDENEYHVKLEATKFLLENVDKTFITPVFNGSASLRDAAGQMIEEVTKAARRKKTVDDAFIDNLQQEMVALYHLDEIEHGGARNDLGALPRTSVYLLAGICLAWAGIGAAALLGVKKKRKNR